MGRLAPLQLGQKRLLLRDLERLPQNRQCEGENAAENGKPGAAHGGRESTEAAHDVNMNVHRSRAMTAERARVDATDRY